MSSQNQQITLHSLHPPLLFVARSVLVDGAPADRVQVPARPVQHTAHLGIPVFRVVDVLLEPGFRFLHLVMNCLSSLLAADGEAGAESGE